MTTRWLHVRMRLTTAALAVGMITTAAVGLAAAPAEASGPTMTKKWFYIESENSPHPYGYVPATTVNPQISVGLCG